MASRFSSIVFAFLLLVCAPGSALADTPTPLQTAECDRLAGIGVEHGSIDAARAIPACRGALVRFPDSARLQFQLARALNNEEQFDEAARLFRQAADKGNVEAMVNLGLMYE